MKADIIKHPSYDKCFITWGVDGIMYIRFRPQSPYYPLYTSWKEDLFEWLGDYDIVEASELRADEWDDNTYIVAEGKVFVISNYRWVNFTIGNANLALKDGVDIEEWAEQHPDPATQDFFNWYNGL